MTHLILPAAMIVSVLSARDAALLTKLHGVWRIEGLALSPGLEAAPLARSLRERLGEYVVWDAERKLLVGLPRCPVTKTVLRPEGENSAGVIKLELRNLKYNSFRPAILVLKGTRLLLCYGCNSGQEFPADFDVQRAAQPLILLTLRRIDNHPGLEASRQLVARMQGKWRVTHMISTNDRGEVNSEAQGIVLTVAGNVIVIQREFAGHKKLTLFLLP